MPFASTDQQTTSVSKAHWFALPDDKFAAPPECTYTLVCEATVKGKKIKGTKPWTVWIDPSGGLTEPPKMTGEVTVASGQRQVFGAKPGVMETYWYVKDIGSLARTPAAVSLRPPATSQFYDKIMVHENRHVWQWNQGPWSTYWSPATFFNRVKNITSNIKVGAEQEVKNQVRQQRAIYEREQLRNKASTSPQREADAHNESDKIAPNYRLYPGHP